MKNKSILRFILGLFILFFSGCATTSNPCYLVYHYVPKKISPIEKAIGTIKNLEKNFVDWDAGVPFSSFEIDRYGLRAKWEWTETKEHQTYDTGGFFLGWDYVPTGEYRTHLYQEQHKNSLIIPFSEVTALKLGYLPKESRAFKWGLTVFPGERRPILLRVSDKASACQLADAIATLSNFNF